MIMATELYKEEDSRVHNIGSLKAFIRLLPEDGLAWDGALSMHGWI